MYENIHNVDINVDIDINECMYKFFIAYSLV